MRWMRRSADGARAAATECSASGQCWSDTGCPTKLHPPQSQRTAANAERRVPARDRGPTREVIVL